MTQEDKELLLKDFSARLLYGIKIEVRGNDIRTVRMVDMIEGIVHFVESDSISPFGIHIEHPLTFRQVIKPYLRPMSSMTEEEEKEYINIDNLSYSCPMVYAHFPAFKRIDWLNAHHFDYRGLIEKGLALEAPEGMYN